MIGYDKNPAYLEISADLHTWGQCRPERHTAGEHSVFYFPGELSANRQHPAELGITYDSISLQASYQYIRDTRLLNTVTAFPFNYFWLTADDVQKHILMVETCRYKTPVRINIYPDIQWYIKFEYLCKNPIKYRDSWVGMRQARVSDAVNKAQAGDIDGYDGDLQTLFKIGAGVAYSGTKTDLSLTFEGKIRPLIKGFIFIKNTINSLVGGEEGKNGFGFLPEGIKSLCKATAAKLKRQPVMFEILSPGVSLEAGWKNVYGTSAANLVAQQVETTVKFTPIAGGKGTLDLIAVSSKLPYIGGVVRAVDASLIALGINATFAISAVGKVEAEAKVSGLYHEKTGFTFNNENYSVTLTGRFGLEVELSAKGEWKVKTWILWGDEHSIKAGAVAFASSYFVPRLGLGADRKGPYLEGAVEFSGIKLVLEIYGEYDDVKRSRKKDIEIVKAPKEPIFGGKKYFNDEKK